MKFKTRMPKEILLAKLEERLSEYASELRDPRRHIEWLDSEEGELRLGVPSPVIFSAELLPSDEGGTMIVGDFLPKKEGAIYRLFIAAAARLTWLAVLYGAVLGISLLCGGQSFLLPLIAPISLALLMFGRSLAIRFGRRSRLRRFFTRYFGCIEIQEN